MKKLKTEMKYYQALNQIGDFFDPIQFNNPTINISISSKGDILHFY